MLESKLEPDCGPDSGPDQVAALEARLQAGAGNTLADLAELPLGRTACIGVEEAFVFPARLANQRIVADQHWRELLTGDCIRNWAAVPDAHVIFPYDPGSEPALGPLGPDSPQARAIMRQLWPFRALLGQGGPEPGEPEVRARWYEYAQYTASANRTPLSIAFAREATHNHFFLDRGGKVFAPSAPVIKLRASASEEEHRALVAYLNSSTVCFWMKQAARRAGCNEPRGEAWEERYRFEPAQLAALPIPGPCGWLDELLPVAQGLFVLAGVRLLSRAARCIGRYQPGGALDLADSLAIARKELECAVARMVGLQEEIDWMIYEAFGLLADEDRALLARARAEALPMFPRMVDMTTSNVSCRGVHPGHRPFEVVLARRSPRAAARWLADNGYHSPDEIPATYSRAYQRLIEARITVIERNPYIRILEQPAYKHCWSVLDYAAEIREAGRNALLDAAEQALSARGELCTARGVAEAVLAHVKARELASLVFGHGRDERELLAGRLAELVLGQAVPLLAALRFTDSGREKHARWQACWAAQRARDDAGNAGDVPVPPLYEPEDYAAPAYWQLRGKLDVARERFISCAGAEQAEQDEVLLGWAGWDHGQRAQALVALVEQRKARAATRAELAPLLAGLVELLPWIAQWHGDAADDLACKGLGMGAQEAWLRVQARELGLTLDELRRWEPQGCEQAVAVG